jgi:hypothetical protein
MFSPSTGVKDMTTRQELLQTLQQLYAVMAETTNTAQLDLLLQQARNVELELKKYYAERLS